MKKNLLLLIVTIFALSVYGQDNVKGVLNKTDEAFRKAGGIESNFSIKVYSDNELTGTSKGILKLDGNRFYLVTSETTTWFDGTTQWTYLSNSDEVNITNPTEEELQEINPYAMLGNQRKDYKYSLGKTKSFASKPVTELIMTATSQDNNIYKITVYLDKTYLPVYIIAELQDGTRNEITVTSNQTKKNFADSVFTFDKSKYGKAEIIDLR